MSVSVDDVNPESLYFLNPLAPQSIRHSEAVVELIGMARVEEWSVSSDNVQHTHLY